MGMVGRGGDKNPGLTWHARNNHQSLRRAKCVDRAENDPYLSHSSTKLTFKRFHAFNEIWVAESKSPAPTKLGYRRGLERDTQGGNIWALIEHNGSCLKNKGVRQAFKVQLIYKKGTVRGNLVMSLMLVSRSKRERERRRWEARAQRERDREKESEKKEDEAGTVVVVII